jgi:hypothetical protein
MMPSAPQSRPPRSRGKANAVDTLGLFAFTRLTESDEELVVLDWAASVLSVLAAPPSARRCPVAGPDLSKR